MLIGISGSSTSRSASSSSSINRVSCGRMAAPEVVEFLLEQPYHLRVPGPASPPAPEHVVPGAGIAEVPAPGLGVEGAGERVLDLPDLLAVPGLLVGGHPDADLLAVGHDQREPPLSQLVVGLALQPVVELRRAHLQAVREPAP